MTTAAQFEVLSGKTTWDIGRKVAKRLAQGWKLHGNTWSTGQDLQLEFHQAVIKEPTVFKKGTDI